VRVVPVFHRTGARCRGIAEPTCDERDAALEESLLQPVPEALPHLDLRASVALLDCRHPSSTEVPMRLIGLAAVLALRLFLAPLAVEAQQAGQVWRIGYLTPFALPNPLIEALRQSLRGLLEIAN
jgi:hypothetical protein